MGNCKLQCQRCITRGLTGMKVNWTPIISVCFQYSCNTHPLLIQKSPAPPLQQDCTLGDFLIFYGVVALSPGSVHRVSVFLLLISMCVLQQQLKWKCSCKLAYLAFCTVYDLCQVTIPRCFCELYSKQFLSLVLCPSGRYETQKKMFVPQT